jgi:hypothetical protein
MESSDPNKPAAENARALPRAVIRLLRSGSLDAARTRRVLEIHGIEEQVALAWSVSNKPEA